MMTLKSAGFKHAWLFTAFLILMITAINVAAAHSQDNGWYDPKKFRKTPYKVLFFGDSLLSGHGLADQETTIVSLIQKNFNLENYTDRDAVFKNLSHPGETTSSAVTRIKQAIALKPDILILAIGHNDAMRGVDADIVYNNLNIILKDLSRSGVYTLLVGMQSPRHLGYDYMSRFNSVYDKLAQQNPQVVFMPYLLEGVSGNRMLLQKDQMHPNREGSQIVAVNISEYISKMTQNVKRYQAELDAKQRIRQYMIRKNEAAANRGLPPRYTQEQIDQATDIKRNQ